MRLRLYFTIITTFFLIQITEAQDDLQPKFTPSYPSTADLGRFGNMPVGLFTGSPAVNLEIYTLKDGETSIPITIGYNSNGVQVDGIPKQLGIDWNLIATGVITRTVMDEPDENQPPANLPLIHCEANDSAGRAIAGYNKTDTEKDIFSLNAFGLSVKFLLADDRENVIQIEQSKIKIVYDKSVFYVTDVDGTVYTFGGTNATEQSVNRNDGGSSHATPTEFTTAWYLTKIQKPTGQSPVIFSYTKEWMRYYTSYFEEAVAIERNINNSDNLTSISTPRIQSYKNKQYHHTAILSQIELNGKRIVFEYEYKNPSGEFASYNSKQLISMKIYNNPDLANSLIRTYDFDYYLITPSNEYNNSYTDLNQKLIFLKEIKEKGKTISDEIVKYSFEYYDPEKLPARHSFSKDIYGYFNGSRSANNIFNNLTTGTTISCENVDSPLYNSFRVTGSRRNPNPLFTHYGMLRSIFYATKGKTVIEYEPNIVLSKVFVPGIHSTMDLSAQGIKAKTSAPFYIEKQQVIKVSGSVGASDDDTSVVNCERYMEIPHHLAGQSFTFDIIDATTNIVKYHMGSKNRVIENQICIEPGWYKTTIKTGKCSEASARFSCYLSGSEPHWETKDVPVAGVRVKRTLDHDSNQNIVIKRYYYGDLENLNKSSASFLTKDPYTEKNIDVYTNDIELYDGFEGHFTKSFYRTFKMMSSSKTPLYSFDGIAIGYETVIESLGGDNFENGGIENNFIVNQDLEPMMLCGDNVRNVNFSNSTLNGKQRRRASFKMVANKVKNVFIEGFVYDEKLKTEISNFSGSVLMTGATFELYNTNKYSITSQFNFLSQKNVSKFDVDGLNPVKTSINYNYSINSLQLASQSTKNSKGETLETKYFYPQDPEMASEPFVKELIAGNRIGTPLNTKTFRGQTKLTEQKTIYDKSPARIGFLLPKYILQNKGAAALNNAIDKKIAFDLYDDKGNLLQYTQEGATPVSMIWGYNKTLPVAKIENIAYASIPVNLINELQTASSDKGTEASMLTAVNKVFYTASGLGNTAITTYMYKPLVGVSRITDPSGMSTYYDYDNFNRLKYIKDQDLNVLQTNYYHYKGQVIDYVLPIESIYRNVAISKIYTKNNCPAGNIGTAMTYTVPAEKYTSNISQSDANDKAQKDMDVNGQDWVNNRTGCSFMNTKKSSVFSKNNCSAGTSAVVTYTVAAGTFSSGISQADADAKAQTNIDQNGQAYANANGICTFKNKVASKLFTKNDCEVTGIPATMYYTIAAGTYSSTISQTDADLKAQVDLNNNGQTYVNANSYCTYQNEELQGNFSVFSEYRGFIKIAYFVPSGKYTSIISQVDADNIAQQALSQCQYEYSCRMVECEEVPWEYGLAINSYDCDSISFTIMPSLEEN
ncbi:hypothetical protein BC749_101315 [Flavobacterium araucananum]|uniref:DUF5977 domain-containing protein n=1 Tax=Flavobacterium araucananum TaxID=946678 RepID=A0A227NEU1_9FLAO|nr:DUF5977 domain-containing protein [Flavobacterium araucananum]OXE96065.1 hypothetical protein B0A64_24085 [Flavobacterium araucananum]PWK02252.1 hypothetical protein BC749_101315 [Flavobacterium araucananum]